MTDRVGCRCRLVLRAIAAAALLPGHLLADMREVAYSFTDDGGGGIAIVEIDDAAGKIVGGRTLFQDEHCSDPQKVRIAAGGRILVVTNESEDDPGLFLTSREPSTPLRHVRLSGVPDELRVTGSFGLVTCDDDTLAWVDLARARVARGWSAEYQLAPPGNAPEDVLIFAQGERALVSFQKDSKKGKKFGSRMALIRLPEMKTMADLRLPRTRPDLHIAGSRKEQGPSPEVMLVSESTNTLLVTLDLYGAVALMDWSSAQEGQITGLTYLPTSLDGSWGNAFPDRVALIELVGHPYVLVCNAGEAGGAVLVDLPQRRIARKWKVPPGLEKPVFLQQHRLAVSVCSGKVKRRTGNGLEKDDEPRRKIYFFDFSRSGDARDARLQEIPLEGYARRLTTVASSTGRFVLIASGRGKKAMDQLLMLDAIKKEVVDRVRAAGEISRFAG